MQIKLGQVMISRPNTMMTNSRFKSNNIWSIFGVAAVCYWGTQAELIEFI